MGDDALAQYLSQEVRRFIDGAIDLDTLYDWLTLHTGELARSPDAAARDLDGLAWLMVSEWSIGDRTEEEAREVLRAALGRAG